MSRSNVLTAFAALSTLAFSASAQDATPATAPRVVKVEPVKVLQPDVPVTRVAVPIDANLIAAVDEGSSDIKILDATTLSPKSILKGHTAKVNAIALTTDGKHLASASDDKTVRIWDVTAAKETGKRTFAEAATAVAVTDDGKVASAAGTQVELWNPVTPDAKPITVYTGHKQPIKQLAISRDGKNLVGAAPEIIVCYWGPDGGMLTAFSAHASGVTAIGIDAAGAKAVSAGQDGKVVVFDLKQKKEVARYTGFTDAASAVGISPDGTKLVAASANKVAVIDANSLKEMYELAPFRTKAWYASFTRDGGKIVASGDLDPAVTDPAKKGSIKIYPAR
jgi:WD40 repeat protein